MPVRIGLHVGEVVFKDNNVFGHTVNVTSRIESLGIAGAVLMSSDFKSQIEKNPALNSCQNLLISHYFLQHLQSV